MGSTCSVWLLGGFRVDIDGAQVPTEAWRHRRGAELVKLLALSPGHRLHREQVMEALWPDLDPTAASANLRKALHYARRALGSERSVRADGAMLELWGGGALAVDAEEFEREAAEALDRRDQHVARRAVSGYQGLLPEDRFAPWADAARRRLERRFVQLLRLVGAWEQVVELDPVDEEAHRELIRRSLEAGNRQGAMRQFEALRHALREELGVGPDPETIALYEKVLRLEGPQPSTPAERASSHLAAGLVALNRMELDDAERQARHARALAVEAELGRQLGEASGLLGMAAHARGTWRDVFREEFLETVRTTPALAGFVFDAHLCLAEFSLHGGDSPEQVADYARDLLAVAERYGSVQGRALATLILGESELFAGRVGDARAHLSRAVDLHDQAGATSGRAMALERLARAELASGRRGRARTLLSEALDLSRHASLASHLLVRVHGTRIEGEADRRTAVRVAVEARADLDGRQICEPCSIGFLLASATAFARTGAVTEGAAALDQAERVAGMWHAGPWPAAVWEARAELRLAEGDHRQAAALFREAADLFGRSGHLWFEARARASAAEADAAPKERVTS
jgi:DNA-binding SARP family transcriptional activator